MIVADCCMRSALALNHNPDRNDKSVLLSSWDSETKSGTFFLNVRNFGTTLATCVCWDIISDKNTLYGVGSSLRGKDLWYSSYRENIVDWNVRIVLSWGKYVLGDIDIINNQTKNFGGSIDFFRQKDYTCNSFYV